MKLTKGKKQDEKENKKKEGGRKMEGDKSRLQGTSAFGQRQLPEPPAPVRIQVEPRKASTVSLEVDIPSGKTVKGRRLKTEGDNRGKASKDAFRQEDAFKRSTPSGKESAKDAGVKVEVTPAKKPAAEREKAPADAFKRTTDSTVKVEVKTIKEKKATRAAFKPKPAAKPPSKPAKSVEISTGEKKSAPSVSISIFNQAPAKPAKAAAKKTVERKAKSKPAAKKPAPAPKDAGGKAAKPPSVKKQPKREILGSTLTRPEMYRKPSSVNFMSPSGGKISEDDMKIIRDFMSRTGYLDNSIAEVNIKLSKIARVADIFTEKVNSSQKELNDLKMKVVGLKEERLDKDVSELRERADEMESIVEKISDRLKESREESEKTVSSESKKVKSIREDISGVQSGVKELRETLASLNTELTKLGDFKAFVQDRAKEPQKEAAPDAIKNVTDRFDSLDSRMANMADKLMKVGRDTEKLTDYFMDGMKHMESRITSMENEKSAESRFSAPAEVRQFVPTTYRSHLKHTALQPRAQQAQQRPQPDSGLKAYEREKANLSQKASSDAFNRSSAFRQATAFQEKTPESYELPDDDDIDMDMDMDDDYDMPRRRPMLGPEVAMPQPPSAPPSPQGSGPPAAVKPPGYGQKVSSDAFQEKAIPPAPAPDRGNMFTRLRESTVVRRPIEQIDPDMDIILEHIRDSTRLHESREKITRDLMNAGFDQSLINQAFMRYRVG